MSMNYDKHNVRSLLLALGVGQYNATMMIEDMFIAPATSDPKSPQIILLVKAIQKRLGVPQTGYLNQPTATALRQVVGEGWMGLSWSDNVALLLGRTDSQGAPPPMPPLASFSALMTRPTPADPNLQTALEGVFDFLPDVPGGIVTYGILGYLAYRHFYKRA